MAPVEDRPFLLYIAALESSLGALLAQLNDQGIEAACSHLSRMLIGPEYHYSAIEKVCLALIFAVSKLRHYLLNPPIRLISTPLSHVSASPFWKARQMDGHAL